MQKGDLSEIKDFSIYSREELESIALEMQNELSRQKEVVRQSNENQKMTFRQKYAETILDALPDMLTVITERGDVVAVVSSEETNHSGVPKNKIAGIGMDTFLPEPVYSDIMNSVDQVKNTGQSCSTNHLMYVDGERHYFENRTTKIDDDNYLCICRDITETVKAKTQLERLNYAVGQINEHIFAIDISGEFLFANNRFIKDLEIKNITGKFVDEILANTSFPKLSELHGLIKENNGAYKYIAELNMPNTSKKYYDVMVHSVFDINSEESYWFFARDITLRIEQETKINELNALMDAILTNVPMYLFLKDGSDFKYIYWNKSLEINTGIKSANAVGFTDFDMLPNKEDAKQFRLDDIELITNNKRIEYFEEITLSTGERRNLKTIKAPIVQRDGKLLIIGVSMDITDMKQVEKELIEAKAEADKSNRLKSAFLANMSHEIRTPLNAIVGFAKLILMEDDKDTQHEYAEIIDSNTDLLLQLINDILDLSKIEAGTLDFVNAEMDLNALCNTMLEVHKLKMRDEVSLIYESNDKPLIINNDKNRLSQVFTNLISNSIKFTKHGEIRFGYKVKGNFVEVYVTDTGTGIEKDKLEAVFDRFVKLNNFAKGSGLGLSITKTIIERIGGQIYAESVLGKGTTFRFTIPIDGEYAILDDNKKEKAKIASPAEINLHRKTILIVEDNDSNYLLMSKYLGDKYSHLRASNGLEAISMFKEHNPNIIFMDIKMPIMDGLEATKAIREISKEVPIIALTAFAYDEDKENALSAGCDNFLTKPIPQRVLIDIIAEYIE